MSGRVSIWTGGLVILPYVYSTAIFEGALLPRLLILQAFLLLLLVWQTATSTGQLVPLRLTLVTGCWWLAMAISVAQADSKTEAIGQLSQYLALSLIPLLMLATLDARHLLRLLRVISIASMPITLLGISQYFGIPILDVSSQALPSATFFHRNAAAGYLTGIIPIALLCVLTVKGSGEQKLHLLAGWLGLVFLVFTRTRGAWVGFVVAGVIIFILSRWITHNPGTAGNNRLIRNSFWVAVATVLVAGFIPDRVGSDKPTFDDKKASAIGAVTSIVTPGGHRGRPEIWTNTLSMIGDHPVLGVGLGNWEFSYPAYAGGNQLNVNAAPRRPHNDLLWVASETGVIGLVAYLAFVGISIWVGIAVIRDGSAEHRRIALAGLFVIIAHTIDGQFNFPRERISGATLFWLSLGGLWTLHPQDPRRVLLHRAVYGAIACILIACVHLTVKRIGYDYHHLRVHIAERANDWDAVLDHGNQALDYGAFRANTMIAVGRAYYKAGNIDEAISSYKAGLSLHPNSLNAHNNLGMAYRKAGRTDDAIRELRRAIELYPDFVEAHNNLGNALRDNGEIEASVQTFEKITARNVAIPQVYINAGKSYIAQGKALKATTSFAKALKLDPGNKTATEALRRLRPTHRDP